MPGPNSRARISLTVVWKTFWSLPRNRCWQFLRQLQRLRHQSPASSEESGVFQNLAHYASDYSRLAALLGQPGKIPPPGEVEFLRDILQRPTRYKGAIGSSEVLFLTAFTGILAPARVIEIGTLTGFSAVVIAAALRRQRGKDDAVAVDTIDFRRQCILDETRPTGFEIAILAAELAPMIRVHTPHDSSFVAELAQPNELSMIFIDADHRHPYVLLDLLRVVPYVRGSGWVVLHDIRLGAIGEEMRAAGEPTPWGAPYGVQWLFEQWRFPKINGGNIGAIQLPADRSALVPFALRLMSVPFESEAKVKAHLCSLLYEALGKLT